MKVLQPKMDAFTRGRNGEFKCDPTYGVVPERDYREHWQNAFDRQWEFMGRMKKKGYSVYYADSLLRNERLIHPHD